MNIKLDFMEIPANENTLRIALLEPADARHIKKKVLAQMEVYPLENETPLDAWLKHLHKINNLPFSKPAHEHIANAIMDSRPARMFLWWLA